jgi:hypothetical protein
MSRWLQQEAIVALIPKTLASYRCVRICVSSNRNSRRGTLFRCTELRAEKLQLSDNTIHVVALHERLFNLGEQQQPTSSTHP